MSAAFDRICGLLEPFGLRLQGDRGRAACPAHGGKNRSALSVGLGNESQVLLKCWSGCDVHEVVAALGLELSDLYPRTESSQGRPMGHRRMLSDGQALDLLNDEVNFVAFTALTIGYGRELTSADRERAKLAACRIINLRQEARS